MLTMSRAQLIVQCVVLATRPILLHVFRVSHSIKLSDGQQTLQDIPQVTSALAETCVNSARNSYRLLTRSWIDGTFAALDHFSAQYLFAATTILAVSSLSPDVNNQSDKDDFESATHLLRQLKDLGNISAQEFCYQLDILIQGMNLFGDGRSIPLGMTVVDNRNNLESLQPEAMLGTDPTSSDFGVFGPLVQDFLSQTDTELGVSLPLDDVVFDGLDFWFNMSNSDSGQAANVGL